MRYTTLIAAAFLLLASAAQANNVPRNSPVFSNGVCSRGIVCPGEADYSADPNYLSNLTALANRCVRQNFAIKDSGALIEESAGIDSDNCFTTKSIPKEKVGLTMTPVCCVVPDSSGKTCQIACTLYGVR